MNMMYWVEKSNIKEDEFNLLFIIIAYIPLSWALHFIPSSKKLGYKLREVYASSIGLGSCCYLFGFYNALALVPSTVFLYFASTQCKTPKLTFAISSLSFVYLSMFHVYRYFADYENNSQSFVNILMMQIPRCIYFNWFMLERRQSSENKEKLTISLVDYLCYMFNFVGILTAPVYSYQEHVFMMQNESNDNRRSKRIHSLLLSLSVLVCIYVVLASNLRNWTWTASPEFSTYSVLYRLTFISLSALLIRTRYCVVWIIADIISVFANLSDAETNYQDPIYNINVRNVELNSSTKIRIDNWNITISRWLRKCFYNPLNNVLMLRKETSSLITFILSALWHGFYPAYYISFVLFYLNLQTERLFFKSKAAKYVPGILWRIQMDLAAHLFNFYNWSHTKEFMRVNADLLLFSFSLFMVGHFVKRVW